MVIHVLSEKGLFCNYSSNRNVIFFKNKRNFRFLIENNYIHEDNICSVCLTTINAQILPFQDENITLGHTDELKSELEYYKNQYNKFAGYYDKFESIVKKLLIKYLYHNTYNNISKLKENYELLCQLLKDNELFNEFKENLNNSLKYGKEQIENENKD